MRKLLFYILLLIPLHRSLAQRHMPNPLAMAQGCKGCAGIGTGTLRFKSGCRITAGMEKQLNVLAEQMRANPVCKVVFTGFGISSKSKEQRL